MMKLSIRMLLTVSAAALAKAQEETLLPVSPGFIPSGPTITTIVDAPETPLPPTGFGLPILAQSCGPDVMCGPEPPLIERVTNRSPGVTITRTNIVFESTVIPEEHTVIKVRVIERPVAKEGICVSTVSINDPVPQDVIVDYNITSTNWFVAVKTKTVTTEDIVDVTQKELCTRPASTAIGAPQPGDTTTTIITAAPDVSTPVTGSDDAQGSTTGAEASGSEQAPAPVTDQIPIVTSTVTVVAPASEASA